MSDEKRRRSRTAYEAADKLRRLSDAGIPGLDSNTSAGRQLKLAFYLTEAWALGDRNSASLEAERSFSIVSREAVDVETLRELDRIESELRALGFTPVGDIKLSGAGARVRRYFVDEAHTTRAIATVAYEPSRFSLVDVICRFSDGRDVLTGVSSVPLRSVSSDFDDQERLPIASSFGDVFDRQRERVAAHDLQKGRHRFPITIDATLADARRTFDRDVAAVREARGLSRADFDRAFASRMSGEERDAIYALFLDRRNAENVRGVAMATILRMMLDHAERIASNAKSWPRSIVTGRIPPSMSGALERYDPEFREAGFRFAGDFAFVEDDKETILNYLSGSPAITRYFISGDRSTYATVGCQLDPPDSKIVLVTAFSDGSTRVTMAATELDLDSKLLPGVTLMPRSTPTPVLIEAHRTTVARMRKKTSVVDTPQTLDEAIAGFAIRDDRVRSESLAKNFMSRPEADALFFNALRLGRVDADLIFAELQTLIEERFLSR